MKNKIDFNPNEFIYFVLLPDFINRASNGFILDYQDVKEGDVTYKDRKGYPARYKFTKSQRMIRIPAFKKEEIEAIRNHPQCQGSRNGIFRTVGKENVQLNALFKEMNENKDAAVILDIARLRAQAVNKAFELMGDENEAYNAQLVLGIKRRGDLGSSDMVQYAQNNPKEFLDQVNSADFKARALARKAIDLDVIQKEGHLYKASELDYGIDFDEIVKTILSDKDKREFLERKLEPKEKEIKEKVVAQKKVTAKK